MPGKGKRDTGTPNGQPGHGTVAVGWAIMENALDRRNRGRTIVKTLLNALAWIGLVLSSMAFFLLLPFAIITGEFMNDIELALPGLVFWLFILVVCFRRLFVRKKA